MIPDAPPPDASAPIGRRAIAAFVDVVVCGVAGGGAGLLLASRLGLNPGTRLFAVYLAVLAVGWVYCSALESSAWQATIGKRLSGVVVTDAEGNRLSFAAATLRYFAKTVSALPLFAGFLAAAFTARRQALHDLLATSMVLRRDRVASPVRPEAAASSTGAETPLASRSPVPSAPATPLASRPSVPSAPPATPLASRPPIPSAPAPPLAATAASSARPSPPGPLGAMSVVGVDQAAASRARPVETSAGAASGDGDEGTVLIDAAYAPTILAAPRRGWTLAALSGPDAGRSYDLGWEVRIGREPDNGIRLSDDKASRHHATITQRPDGYVVKDLGSSNGTLVDGERIAEPRLLRPGAEITIGNTKLVLREPGAKA